MSDDERRFESRATDRLVAFSDAVVAIAITLLALDLPVPTGTTMSSFLSSVRHSTDEYVAFLISFVVIAAAWRRYHGVFRYIERIDAHVRNYNVLWLMTIILNPFATRVLTAQGQSAAGPRALQFGFYALLQVLSSAALLLTVHHVAAHDLQAVERSATGRNPERLGVLWRDARFRAVNPALLLHQRRVGDLDRCPPGGGTARRPAAQTKRSPARAPGHLTVTGCTDRPLLTVRVGRVQQHRVRGAVGTA